VLVIAGGGFGSASRYLVSLAAARLFGDSFPWGTIDRALLNALLNVLIGFSLTVAGLFAASRI